MDIWETTTAKLPPILNCVWRKRLCDTGSREFCEFLLICRRLKIILLQYSNTIKHCQQIFVQEQRCVEQERPTNSHIGLTLLALLIFPPVGKLVIKYSSRLVLNIRRQVNH